MSAFEYNANRDESFLSWSDAALKLISSDASLEPSTTIVQATDSEASLLLYVVPNSSITDAVQGALGHCPEGDRSLFDSRRFSYGDCLADPEMAAAALRVLNALGLLDDAPGLLAQITQSFVKEVETAFARARPRDREQVPEIIAGMKSALPSLDELAENKGALRTFFVGEVSDGDEAWQLQQAVPVRANVTREFIYNLPNHW